MQQLTAAIESGDAHAVECAVVGAYRVGLSPDFVPAFLALLPQPSHRSHEDIVLALQRLKDPRAVDALYEAASVEHEHLAYDEFSGLGWVPWFVVIATTHLLYAAVMLYGTDPLPRRPAERQFDADQR